MAPNVVGMNIYKEIQMKVYGWTGNQTKDPCITGQVLYHWATRADIHSPSSLNFHIIYFEELLFFSMKASSY